MKKYIAFQLIVMLFFFNAGYGQGFATSGFVLSTPSTITVGALNCTGIFTSPAITGTTNVNGVTIGGMYVGNRNVATATAYGVNALNSLGSSGVNNTAFGHTALSSLVSGTNNAAFGYFSGRFNTGTGNTFLGAMVAFANTVSGGENVACGGGSMALLASGNSNSSIGSVALQNNVSSNANTALGYFAMQNHTAGDSNVAVGCFALRNATTGTENVALGHNALTSTSGNNNVGLGANTILGNGNDQLSIMNVMYGTNMSSATAARTSIGVNGGVTQISGGLSNLQFAKLHVGGTSGSIPSLQLDVIPSTTTPQANYLFVDAGGVVSQAPLPTPTGVNTCSLVNYLPKTNSTNGNMICSQVYDNGTNVGIGVGASPTAKLDIDCAGGHIKLQNLAAYSSSHELRTLIIDPDTWEVWMGSSSNNRQSNTCSLDCDAINNAIKSQQSQIEQQEIKIANQQTEINELKNKINQLVPGNVIVKDDNFQITPNPVTGTSTVNYKMDVSITNAVFIIYDLQGKMLKKYSVDTNAKQGQVQINKKDFGNGMYILSLVSNNQEIQSKHFIISE